MDDELMTIDKYTEAFKCEASQLFCSIMKLPIHINIGNQCRRGAIEMS
jgi:hypothetical protein